MDPMSNDGEVSNDEASEESTAIGPHGVGRPQNGFRPPALLVGRCPQCGRWVTLRRSANQNGYDLERGIQPERGIIGTLRAHGYGFNCEGSWAFVSYDGGQTFDTRDLPRGLRGGHCPGSGQYPNEVEPVDHPFGRMMRSKQRPHSKYKKEMWSR